MSIVMSLSCNSKAQANVSTRPILVKHTHQVCKLMVALLQVYQVKTQRLSSLTDNQNGRSQKYLHVYGSVRFRKLSDF